MPKYFIQRNCQWQIIREIPGTLVKIHYETFNRNFIKSLNRNIILCRNSFETLDKMEFVFMNLSTVFVNIYQNLMLKMEIGHIRDYHCFDR